MVQKLNKEKKWVPYVLISKFSYFVCTQILITTRDRVKVTYPLSLETKDLENQKCILLTYSPMVQELNRDKKWVPHLLISKFSFFTQEIDYCKDSIVFDTFFFSQPLGKLLRPIFFSFFDRMVFNQFYEISDEVRESQRVYF